MRVSFARPDQPAILAADADRQCARLVDQSGNILIDRAGQHHLDDLDHRLVGHPQPVHEARLYRQPLQHRVDLRPAAMHDDRVHADLFEQRDVPPELLGQMLVTHGMAAVFDHDGHPRIAAEKRQRLYEDTSLLGGSLKIEGQGHGS